MRPRAASSKGGAEPSASDRLAARKAQVVDKRIEKSLMYPRLKRAEEVYQQEKMRFRRLSKSPVRFQASGTGAGELRATGTRGLLSSPGTPSSFGAGNGPASSTSGGGGIYLTGHNSPGNAFMMNAETASNAPSAAPSPSRYRERNQHAVQVRSNVEKLPWESIDTDILFTEKTIALSAMEAQRKPWKRRLQKEKARHTLKNSSQSPHRGDGTGAGKGGKALNFVEAGYLTMMDQGTVWDTIEHLVRDNIESRKFRKVLTPTLPADLFSSSPMFLSKVPGDDATTAASALAGISLEQFLREKKDDPTCEPKEIDRLWVPRGEYELYSPHDMMRAARGEAGAADGEPGTGAGTLAGDLLQRKEELMASLWTRGDLGSPGSVGGDLHGGQGHLGSGSLVDDLLFGSSRDHIRLQLMADAQYRIDSSPVRGRLFGKAAGQGEEVETGHGVQQSPTLSRSGFDGVGSVLPPHLQKPSVPKAVADIHFHSSPLRRGHSTSTSPMLSTANPLFGSSASTPREYAQHYLDRYYQLRLHHLTLQEAPKPLPPSLEQPQPPHVHHDPGFINRRQNFVEEGPPAPRDLPPFPTLSSGPAPSTRPAPAPTPKETRRSLADQFLSPF